MKFELIEFPEAEPSESAPEDAEPETVRSADSPADADGDDPVAGINAAAARLAGRARAEGERIDASLAELAAVLRKPPPGWRAAEPPDNFRAGRFSKGDR